MRDTDQDWNVIAEKFPYFGVLSQAKFKEPSQTDIAEFFGSGRHEIDGLLAKIRREFGDFSPKSGLDFGCGVGRLVLPMAKVCGSAYGVDIADNMLRLTAQHAKEFGVTVETATEIPKGRQFDWVNSIIVLQHIPPVRGYEIIRQMWGAVAVGGVMSLHITVYKDQRFAEAMKEDMKFFKYDGESITHYVQNPRGPGHMSMFDYEMSRVMAIINPAPGQRIVLEKTLHGACHGFLILVQKQ